MTKNHRHHNITHDCTLIKQQFMESNGIVTITGPHGVILISAVVYGLCNMKDVTDTIKYINGQTDLPIDCIEIDTGKLNEYTECDIEFGQQKMIQIDYIKCCGDHTHHCSDHCGDHTHNQCIPIIPPPPHHCPCHPHPCPPRPHPCPPRPHPCPPRPHPCPPHPCPPHPHPCPPHPHPCPPHPHPCPPRPHPCPPQPHPCPPHPCPPHPHPCPPHPHPCPCPPPPHTVNYSENLLFPLYPIHKPIKYCNKIYSQQYPIRGPFCKSISPDLQCNKKCKCAKCRKHH